MKKSIKALNSILIVVVIFIMINCGLTALAVNNDETDFTASPVIYTVSLNAQEYKLQAYAINGEIYFKLRDMALILNGTTARFQVEWNSIEPSISITTQKAYSPTGSELILSGTDSTASFSVTAFYIDGNKANLTVYLIDGNTYLKPDDLAAAIGFSVSVDASTTKMVISNAQMENYEDENGYVLTLKANENEALLNGNAITLSAKPFIKNGILYIPLKDVTELLGGNYSFNNNVATVELFNVTTKYEVGSRSIVVNGETYKTADYRQGFEASGEKVATDDNFVPVIVNGIVFIPDQFTGWQCPYNSLLSGLREYPESKMIILGGFEQEQGINEVKLLSLYDSLSSDFRTKMKDNGIVSEVLNYNITEYSTYGLEVYVMRLKDSETNDIEGMDGRVCAIKVNNPSYSTRRGLKVGDSAYRAWLLYGYDNLSDSFFYKVRSGMIDSMVFYTRYYGSNF